MSGKRIRLGVVFGGMSSEHEVSLASAWNVLGAIDRSRFEVTPIGIRKDGRWVVGEGSLAHLIAHADEERLPRGLKESVAGHFALQGANPLGGMSERPLEELERELLFSRTRLPEFSGSFFSLCDLDCVFPVLHGRMGEDGTIQGLLAIAGVAVVGCGVLASSVCMDKIATKMLLDAAGISQAPWTGFDRSNFPDDGELQERVAALGGYPVFVKPANSGSSVGISKVRAEPELRNAIERAMRYDRRVLIEKSITGRELEISILGGRELETAPVVSEIIPKREFYDYAAKYIDDTTIIELPAKVSPDVVERIRDLAKRAFRAVDGSGMARVDFFYDPVADTVYVNEINTIPGFTAISQYPALMEHAGISYPELITRLVEIALERKREMESFSI